MQIVDAINNLTLALQGSGSVEDISTDQIADAIQYMADNWDTISAGIGGGEAYEPVSYTHLDVYKRQIKYRPYTIF